MGALFADGRIVALPSLAHLTDMLPQPHQAIAEHFNRSPDALVSLLGDAADGSITRESVAAHFQITPSYISHLFKRYSDCSFNQLLQRLRLNHAAKLLTSSDMPIKLISSECG